MHGTKNEPTTDPHSHRPAAQAGAAQGGRQVAAFLSDHADGVVLAIKLQPRASKNEIGEPLGTELRIKVTAPPVDAAANAALIRLLAETLGCPKGKVELLRGHTSRHKVVMVYGMTSRDIQARLGS